MNTHANTLIQTLTNTPLALFHNVNGNVYVCVCVCLSKLVCVCLWFVHILDLVVLLSLPHFQLSLWISEKLLTAQDMSYDEARNLHSKWLKHQAFMAELQSNKEWLEKIQKV